jgi:Tfp pilus assembly protein PilN
MSNLIPPQGHTSVGREYILRILSVYGFLLVVSLVALCALVVPTYVLVNTQLTLNESHAVVGSSVDTAFNDAETEIKKANELITQLAAPSKSVHASQILNEIDKSVHRGVEFKTFQIQQTQEKNETIVTVNVQGIAESRGALAAFKEGLEASPLFEHAEVPISDLARDTELPFMITLTVTREALKKS